MTAFREQVARVVSDVIDTIRVSGVRGDHLACVDLDGCPPHLVSSAIMTTLVSMNYIAFIAMPGGLSESTSERIYIDLQRKRSPTVSLVPQV